MPVPRTLAVSVELDGADQDAPRPELFAFAADGSLIERSPIARGRGALDLPARGEAVTDVLVGVLPPKLAARPPIGLVRRYGGVPLRRPDLALGKAHLTVDEDVWR